MRNGDTYQKDTEIGTAFTTNVLAAERVFEKILQANLFEFCNFTCHYDSNFMLFFDFRNDAIVIVYDEFGYIFQMHFL